MHKLYLSQPSLAITLRLLWNTSLKSIVTSFQSPIKSPNAS